MNASARWGCRDERVNTLKAESEARWLMPAFFILPLTSSYSTVACALVWAGSGWPIHPCLFYYLLKIGMTSV